MVIAIIGLIDLPGQLERWGAKFAWLVQLSSDTARWLLFGVGMLMALLAYEVPKRLWRLVSHSRKPVAIGQTAPAARLPGPVSRDPAWEALDAISRDLARSSEARRTAASPDSRLGDAELADAIFGSPFRVRQERTREQLVLWLHLLSGEPRTHLAVSIVDLSRWIPEIAAYAPVPQFADATEEWLIALSGGARRLHYDAPAPYAVCALGGGQPHVQYVVARGRHGCPLSNGTYKLSVRFAGNGQEHQHVSFIRVAGGDAEFTTDPK